ncbi:Polyamine-transporting ATPase [Actinobacteria bacterium OK074]|nr:Polyamine-transporting ATPase [Actinobacteria bacterium OK074]
MTAAAHGIAVHAADGIAVHGLTKRYPDGTEAVRGISFAVPSGQIVGLVGPNGAGKSSALNMLATLTSPTEGDAHVYGVSVRDRAAVRPLLGVALQATGLDPMMSVADHFAVHAALHGMRARPARVRAGELQVVFRLTAVRRRRVGELSGGTQRRVALALALLHEPRAIVFDEPTVALDPNLRRAVWDLLADLRGRGLAVLFSTHYMDEAEHLCQRVELMSKGRIVASGTPDELKATVAAGRLRIRVRHGAEHAVRALELAATRGLLPAGAAPVVADGVVEIPTGPHDTRVDALLALLAEFDVAVADLHWGHGTLDDVFTRLAEATEQEPASSVPVEHRALARRGGGRT